MRKIDSIILHCSATEEGKNFKASDIDRWHRAQGWNGIGYHYVVDIDGTVEKGRDIEKAGAHCSGHNAHSIGLVYIGGLRAGKAADTRTAEQKESLYIKVYELLKKYSLLEVAVHCHNEYSSKACPCFKIETFMKEFKEWKDRNDISD